MKSLDHKREASIRCFANWSETYDRFIFKFWMDYIIRKVVQQVDLRKDTSLLDVGCGTGAVFLEIAPKVTEGELCGVDLSEEMLEKARKKLKDSKNVEFVHADILEFRSSTKFDAVTSTEAFHHFVAPGASIKAMALQLKKGGKLILADIHFVPLFFWNILWKLEPGFVKMYSRKELRRMFEDAGLKVIKQERVFAVGLMTVGEKA